MVRRPLSSDVRPRGTLPTRGRTRRGRPRTGVGARGRSSRGAAGRRARSVVPVRLAEAAEAAFREFGPTARRRRPRFTAKNLRPCYAPQTSRAPLPGRGRGAARRRARLPRRRARLWTAQARPTVRAVRDTGPKADQTAVSWPSIAMNVAFGGSATLRGQEGPRFHVFSAKK